MMPMTLPSASTSAPPESPGWMVASIWIRPDSCSDVPSAESCAVIDWSSAVTRAGDDARAPRRWPTGVADGDDLVADGDLGGVAERRGRQAGGADQLDDRDVVRARRSRAPWRR